MSTPQSEELSEQDVYISHLEYIAQRRSGRLDVTIPFSLARRLVECIPSGYRSLQLILSWVWLLSIPAFLLVAIFVKWWIGLLLLLFATPVLNRLARRAMVQSVMAYAEADQDFFGTLLKNDAFVDARRV